MDPQKHEMILEKTHSSGAEEWYCPTCQRRMAITWQPWRKIVLEPGDITAGHSGSKGGLQMSLSPIDPDTPEDPYLEPWRRWLDKRDSDDF